MSEQASNQQPKPSTQAQLPQIGDAPLTLPASGNDFQPLPYDSLQRQRKIANPAPLGLAAFAATMFLLSIISLGARNIYQTNHVVALAFAYGGLVQLLAGMWAMAIGNTFGATIFSSYGGFWLSFALMLTPAYDIAGSYTGNGISTLGSAFALYLWAWFVFTTLCMLLTLRSTLAFMSLFIFTDMAFLCWALAAQNFSTTLNTAGGAFGIAAAFLAWYNMFAGLANRDNFWLNIPVVHLAWSAEKKAERSMV